MRPLLTLWLWLLMAYVHAAESPREVVVVTHSSVVADAMSGNRLRSLFALQVTRWPDGTPVKVVVLADDDPLHRHFTKSRLSLYPHQLRRRWDRIVFAGRGLAPLEARSPEEMRALIANTPGAIGYLPAPLAVDAAINRMTIDE